MSAAPNIPRATIYELAPFNLPEKHWEDTVNYTPEDGGSLVIRRLNTTPKILEVSGSEPGGYWIMRLDDPTNESGYDGGILWPVKMDPYGKFAERAHASVARFMMTENAEALETLVRSIPGILDIVTQSSVS